jgi:hypothetical protein
LAGLSIALGGASHGVGAVAAVCGRGGGRDRLSDGIVCQSGRCVGMTRRRGSVTHEIWAVTDAT